MSIERPVLAYPGGKWRIAPWILQHAPSHTYYVEPFGGGGSVLLSKSRSRYEIYNDINKEVVCLFRVLRDNPDEFIRKVELTPYSRVEYEIAFEDTLEDIEIARRLLYRVSASFGTEGVLKNKGTWLYSKYREHALTWSYLADHLLSYTERLKGVYIECKDGLEVIQQWDDKDTWHYVDPPYVLDSRVESQVYSNEMTDDNHKKLSDVLHQAKGKISLSGYNTPLYEDLYKGWHKIEKEVQVWGHKSDGTRAKRIECLWMNYTPETEDLPFFNL